MCMLGRICLPSHWHQPTQHAQCLQCQFPIRWHRCGQCEEVTRGREQSFGHTQVAVRFIHPPHDQVGPTVGEGRNHASNLAHVERIDKELNVLAPHATFDVVLDYPGPSKSTARMDASKNDQPMSCHCFIIAVSVGGVWPCTMYHARLKQLLRMTMFRPRRVP